MNCGSIIQSCPKNLNHHLTNPRSNLEMPSSQNHLGFFNTTTSITTHFKSHSKTNRICSPIKATTTINNFCVTQTENNFYDLLGISESGSLSEIKKAYKQLARKYHPDVSPPDCLKEYTKRFIQVQEAYEILSDPNSRALYDSYIASGFHLAFSARKQFHSHEGLDEGSEWQQRWQSQLEELKRRSTAVSDHDQHPRHNMSWGARMRQQQHAKK